jgi:hypothetical protein
MEIIISGETRRQLGGCLMKIWLRHQEVEMITRRVAEYLNPLPSRFQMRKSGFDLTDTIKPGNDLFP